MEKQIILQIHMFAKDVCTTHEIRQKQENNDEKNASMWEKFLGSPAFHTILDTFSQPHCLSLLCLGFILLAEEAYSKNANLLTANNGRFCGLERRLTGEYVTAARGAALQSTQHFGGLPLEVRLLWDEGNTRCPAAFEGGNATSIPRMHHIFVLSGPALWRYILAQGASNPKNLVVIEMAQMLPMKRALPSQMCLGSFATASTPGVRCNPHTHAFPLLLAKEISDLWGK